MAATDGGRCEDDIAASRGRAERGRPTCYLQKSLSAVAGVGAVAAPCLLLFPCPPSAAFAPVFVKRAPLTHPASPVPPRRRPPLLYVVNLSCHLPNTTTSYHSYLLPYLLPKVLTVPTLPSSVSVDSLLSALITLSYHDLPLPTTSYEVPPTT